MAKDYKWLKKGTCIKVIVQQFILAVVKTFTYRINSF